MAWTFIRSAARNLLRHKIHTLINLASLAIGLTIFGFAFLYVKQELSYDQGWPDGERVHRLTLEQRGFPGLPDRSYAAALARSYARLMDNFGAEFSASSRVVVMSARPAEIEQLSSLWFVDPGFVEIFQPEVIEGNLARAVSGPGFIAVDEAYAQRVGLVGKVGDRVTLQGPQDGEIEYELAAIYRLPKPISSSVNFPMFTLMHTYSMPLFGTSFRAPPWDNQSQVWVKLRPGLDTDAFNALMPEYIQQNVIDYAEALGPERKVSDHLFYTWQPITALHFNPLTTEAFNSGAAFGDPGRVATFAAVGLLVLLVGCSNSISLSLAAALERRREIGVRKAAGALPQDILGQQLGEAVLLALIALVPAIATLELLLPAFQALLPFARVDAGWREYLLLTAIAVAVGLACGVYPALILSSTRPQNVLRAGAQENSPGRWRLRTVLVGVQYFLASILLIGTAALYLQLAVARQQPLGFNVDNVVMPFANPPDASFAALRVELEKIPGVVRAIPNALPPNAGIPPSANADAVVRNIGDSNEVNVYRQRFDFDFIELTGMRVIAGRDFDRARDDRDWETTREFSGGVEPVMLNESAVRRLGFPSPEEAIEQPLFARRLNNVSGVITNVPLRIIGVVEDNLYTSLRNRPGPEMYTVITAPPGGVATNSYMVKYEPSVEGTIQQRLQEVARNLGVTFGGMIFAEQQLAQAFEQEQNESRLLLICGGIALLLASFGLYGLAAFALERQIKEVGIRKAMGAQVASIVTLYLWRFGRPIVIANLVAWPVAIYFVLQWIQRFPYQMERAWLAPLCIGVLGAVLLIAVLTVSVITTRAATANPVRSLRYE